MRKSATLAGILAMASMLGDMPMLTMDRKPSLKMGNQGWGRYHDPKVKKSRAKEKRAKLARKINWN